MSFSNQAAEAKSIAMELEITHTTRYEFSQPVYLEPHVLRFQPRADGAQMPLEYRLEIEPQPAGMSSFLDAAGNAATCAWFDGCHQSLSIAAHSVTRTLRENPYDFLLDRTRTLLPVDYGVDAAALQPYLRRPRGGEDGADPIAVLASRMRDAARGELMPLLSSLTRTLYDRLRVVRREDGEAWPAERTWREQAGACRDLAVLFVDACRVLGVAARFVSGYEDPGGSEPCDLHAWAEVYVPGGGWRGYDPSRGLAVADSHVAVAASATALGSAPVEGSFRGTGVTAEIHTEIRVEPYDSKVGV